MFLRRILPFLSDSRRNCASCSGLLHQIDRRSLVQRMVRRNPQLDGTESQTETLPILAYPFTAIRFIALWRLFNLLVEF